MTSVSPITNNYTPPVSSGIVSSGPVPTPETEGANIPAAQSGYIGGSGTAEDPDIIVVVGKSKPNNLDVYNNLMPYSGASGAADNSARDVAFFFGGGLNSRAEALGNEAHASMSVVDDISTDGMYQEVGFWSKIISNVMLNLNGVEYTFLNNGTFKNHIVSGHNGTKPEKSVFSKEFLASQEIFQKTIIDTALDNAFSVNPITDPKTYKDKIVIQSQMPFIVGSAYSIDNKTYTPTNIVTIVIEPYPEGGMGSWKIKTAHPGYPWN